MGNARIPLGPDTLPTARLHRPIVRKTKVEQYVFNINIYCDVMLKLTVKG